MKGSTGWKGSCCTCKGLPPSWIGTCFLFLQIQSFERFLLLATSTTTTTDSLTLFPSFCRECFLSIDQNISFPFKSNHSNQRVFDSLKTRKREKRFLSIIQKLSLPSIQIFHLLKNLTIQRTARPLAGGGTEVLFSFLLSPDWGQIVPLSFFPNVPFSSPWMFPFLKNQPFKELWGLHSRHEEGLSCHFPSLCWSEQETVQNVSCSEKTLDTLSWIGTKRFLYIQIR